MMNALKNYPVDNANHWMELLNELEETLNNSVTKGGITRFRFNIPDDGVVATSKPGFLARTGLATYRPTFMPTGWTIDLMEFLQKLGFETSLEVKYRRNILASFEVSAQRPGENSLNMRIINLKSYRGFRLSAKKCPSECTR
ncbi:MAG: hypothetical protein P4L53_06415 [Candidatus Obscuribacterales bacterium]|nr:hypothetical protein [Candidatus Obscuribacterales bacterium]